MFYGVLGNQPGMGSVLATLLTQIFSCFLFCFCFSFWSVHMISCTHLHTVLIGHARNSQSDCLGFVTFATCSVLPMPHTHAAPCVSCDGGVGTILIVLVIHFTCKNKASYILVRLVVVWSFPLLMPAQKNISWCQKQRF